ncbi:sulfotransferase family protein [Ancylobacter sp. MQZ15Z-1]|uniref:Sulfotransferase family protein n=1 Tax=Ancylobacter mangrovi TaxID=2972472 RepID=A0A9X2T2I1_9HYPH|nr:sulfotransferase family protein [Ancylobacter mangrovi]MCS0493836.1 sulfotransferase family protein [Ancylobacter mangrovi]
MILSHRHRFVLFAPWKTASSTAHLRLQPLNESPYSRFFDFQPALNRVVHQHITCADFNALPEARLDYRRASFVRNPYDRVCSGFVQLQRDIATQMDVPFPQPWIRELVREQLDENRRQLEAAGYDLNAWIATITERQVYETGRNTNFSLHPAHYWTHLAGEPYVGFVGRVERFEPEFERLCGFLGIPVPPRADENVTDAAMLGSDAYRYADRLDRASIERINALFARDFELFDYARL